MHTDHRNLKCHLTVQQSYVNFINYLSTDTELTILFEYLFAVQAPWYLNLSFIFYCVEVCFRLPDLRLLDNAPKHFSKNGKIQLQHH